MALASCSACGESDMTALFVVAGHAYVACRSCQSAQLDPLPPADPVDLYDAGYFIGGQGGGYVDYDADATVHRRNARRRLDRLASAMAPGPQHLIDVGCASGFVLDDAAAREWSRAGVDPSAHARSVAAARGHDVYADLAVAIAHGAPPSAITFYQVLEHQRDPAASLRTAADALAPRGVVGIETWDRTSWVARLFGSRWQQANPPTVIHLFSRTGLSRLLERCGFEVLAVHTGTKYVSARHVGSTAAARWPRTNGLLAPIRRPGRLGDVAVPYRLPDLVTAEARRL
jgi:SAM-dependent methyltransferase